MSVQVHPKVTTAQLQALLQRHGLICHHVFARGRLRVLIEPDPARLPFRYLCEVCAWVGAEPLWEVIEVLADPFHPIVMEAGRCPACRSFSITTRVNS